MISFDNQPMPSWTRVFVAQGTCRQFPAGVHLYRQGEAGSSVFLVANGMIKLVRTNADGHDTLLGIKMPGDVVGVEQILEGTPRLATAIAIDAVEVWNVSAEDLFKSILKDHGLNRAVVEALAQTTYDLAGRLADQTLSVDHRLARFLAKMATRLGTVTQSGIELPRLTQSELASAVGASTRTIERALHQLRREGILQLGYRKLTIRDLAALRAKASELTPDLSLAGAARTLCIAVEIHDLRPQPDTASELDRIVSAAATAAGLRPETWLRQYAGDGALVVTRGDESQPQVVDEFVRELTAELESYNRGRPAAARLRLRIAMDSGVAQPSANGLAGAAVVAVSRLVDASPVREAMHAEGTDVVLVLSHRVFHDTVASGHTSLSPSSFRRIRFGVKEFTDDAWVWARAGSDHLAPRRDRPRASDPTESPTRRPAQAETSQVDESRASMTGRTGEGAATTPPDASGTMPVPFVIAGVNRFVLAGPDPFTFGRSRDCTLCLDEADIGIARFAGSVYQDRSIWWLENTSASRPLSVVDDLGFRRVLIPGRRMAIEEPVRVLIDGTNTSHALELHMPNSAKAPQQSRPEDETEGDPGSEVLITENDRLALVALCSGYLEESPRYDPYPRSYAAAAARLGWPRTTLVKRIEYLRARLDAAGVPNMTGWAALTNLAEYAISRRVIGREDLARLKSVRVTNRPVGDTNTRPSLQSTPEDG